MSTNAENSIKIVQTSRSLGGNLWAKFENLTVLGAVFPHFCPDECEIWHGPLPCAKFHIYQTSVCRRCRVKNPCLDH